MRAILVVIVLLVYTFQAKSQRLMLCNPGTALPADSLTAMFDIVNTEWKGALFRSAVSDRKSGKLLEEYLRNDDSAFLFIEYDAHGKSASKGFLKLSPVPAASFVINIPDFAADPTGILGMFKDTAVYDYCYQKHGPWKEVFQPDSIMVGSYINGLRHGPWQIGGQMDASSTEAKYLEKLYDNFKAFRTIHYEAGKLTED